MSRLDGDPELLDLDSALAAGAPALSVDEQRLGLAVYRLLATGRPVEVAAAASAAYLPTAAADRMGRPFCFYAPTSRGERTSWNPFATTCCCSAA